MRQLYLKRGTRLVNEQGSVLVMAALVVVVLLALSAVFLLLASNEANLVERQRRESIAFHIAEAGIERMLYDLRQDFYNDLTSPSWADGSINGITIGPDTSNFITVPYAFTSLNDGNYTVKMKNLTSSGESIWVQSTGTYGDASQLLQIYVTIKRISPWDNAIFAGAGASGAMVNGNVNIRGSVHILGSGLSSSDYAIDLGGTAELVGNNYNSLDATLKAKVPALPTVIFGGETVETLNAELRVKRGIIGLSGSSTVGEANVTGNSVKESVDGSYVTDGFGGTQGESSVYSDNGWSVGYDLGDSVAFPHLSDPYQTYTTYQAYLRDNALVISSASDLSTLANITPGSSFSFSNTKGSISMDGSGNMVVSGIVYVDGGGVNMAKAGSDKTITYTGSAAILATGNINVNVNLITPGNNSYPNNIIGMMTPGSIGFNEASIDVMGLFYAETSVVVQKQTDIMGTIVSNYFDMGTNVPSIFQVPETINHLPVGLIGQSSAWSMTVVSWQKL
jgi:hypothetical protein